MVKTFNNSLVVGATEFKVDKYTEENSIYAWYKKDTFANYKGMLALWNQRKLCTTPILNAAELTNSVMYVNGPRGEFEYSVPYELDPPYIVENLIPLDTTPGKGGRLFKIKLSENCFTNTEYITYDWMNGKQLYISDNHEIIQEPDGWVYTVELITYDKKNDFFPPEKLKAGTPFFKVSNANSEYSTQKGTIRSKFGTMRLKNKLTGHRSVYHWITGYANMLKVNDSAYDYISNAYGDIYKNKKATMVVANTDENGQLVKGSTKWINMIDAMLWAEMKNSEEKELTWAKGGIAQGSGRGHVEIGKGLFEQMKAGNHLKYTNLTKSLFDRIFGQLFYGSNIPIEDRRVEVQLGTAAMIEVSKMIENEFGKVPFGINVGKDANMNIISGDRMNLSFGYRFTSMQFPNAGFIEFKVNPAFDNYTSRSEMLIGNFSPSSHIIAIFDVTDTSVSNAAAKMETNHRKVDSFNEGSNIVIVKPEGRGDISWGYEIGTEAPPGFSNQSLVASSQRDGYAIWMKQFSSLWLKDATRSVFLEKDMEQYDMLPYIDDSE